MFGFGKKTVTHEDLAISLCNFAFDYAGVMVKHDTATSAAYSAVRQDQLLHETVVMILWTIHRAATGCDKVRLMGLIHRHYFAATGYIDDKQASTDERELLVHRYKQYDAAFKPEDGIRQFMLGGTIAGNRLQQFTLNTDVVMQAKEASTALLLMNEVRDICGKNRIVK